MINLSHRSATFTDSVIRRMTRISDEYSAINLSQGFPDFDPPKALTESLARVAASGPHQYSITHGSKGIRYALSDKIKRHLDLDYDAETQLCVTCGSTEAMMAVVLSTLNPADKVAIFSPFYENYGADVILSGATPVYIHLIGDKFKVDYKALDSAFASGARALILCNPSNPCGKVFTLQELERIASIVKKYDAFVITDEVYEHMVYAPYRHISMASVSGMYERTIICNSLSKTYSITGWRLGYVAGPAYVIDRVRKVHDFLTVGAASPLQEAVITALDFDKSYYDEINALYSEKRKLFLQGLDAIGLKHNEVQGAYYVLVDINDFGYECDYEFCLDLIRKVGVAAVPGSTFFKDGTKRYIRLHFAKSDATLMRALERLKNIHSLKRR